MYTNSFCATLLMFYEVPASRLVSVLGLKDVSRLLSMKNALEKWVKNIRKEPCNLRSAWRARPGPVRGKRKASNYGKKLGGRKQTWWSKLKTAVVKVGLKVKKKVEGFWSKVTKGFKRLFG